VKKVCCAVLFDLRGTLVPFSTFRENAPLLTALAGALQVERQDFVRLWMGLSYQRTTGRFASLEACLQYICSLLHRPPTTSQLTAAVQLWKIEELHALIPEPDAIEVLTALRQADYKTGLVSNCSVGLPSLWPETSFASLIDTAAFSCVVGVRKPHPAIYYHVCDQLGVFPVECLYIGDGGNNELAGARRVGMHAVLLRRSGNDPYIQFRPESQTWRGTTISTLDQIFFLLQEMGMFCM
jgi:putative hydrolase of the HAD superfamily